MPIRVLSDAVAAQIAAGEVIERPASVAKELVENALDAGAMTITIESEQGGRRLLRVSDDGCGIPPDEVALAFHRHSTSKLQTVQDLERIATLGFRGEALASIAAVSRTTMVTRHRETDVGATILVEGGEGREVRPVGAPVGTMVTVENLFFNTPARLKFLKSESTERRHISQLVTHYAMAYPHVRFRLVQEGREQFRSTGSGDLADVLVEAYGLDVFQNMVEVSPLSLTRPDLPTIEVYGFSSTPELTRANRNQIVLFVNGRSIMDQSLTYAVVQTYHQLLPKGRYPLAVLMITLPPDEVDVNVHPTKAEVRFRVPDAVFATVQRAIRTTMAEQSVAFEGGVTETEAAGWGGQRGYVDDLTDYPFPQRDRPLVPGERQLQMELGPLLPVVGKADGVRDAPGAIPAGPGQPLRPRTLPIMRVIGQVGAMYVVAEGPAGLYLIDQHAAHQRVLFEMLSDQVMAGKLLAQHTLSGATVELPAAAARALEAVLEELAETGFELELFGGNTFRVRAVPVVLVDVEPAYALRALVEDLQAVEDAEMSLLELVLRRVSALAAYKAGQVLSFDDMQRMVQALERCQSPRVDLFGRPTLLHISGEELARQFGRR